MASYRNQSAASRYILAAVGGLAATMFTSAGITAFKSFQYSMFEPSYSNDSPPLTFNNALEGTKAVVAAAGTEFMSLGSGGLLSVGVGLTVAGLAIRPSNPRE